MNYLAHAVFSDGPDDFQFASLAGDYLDKSQPDITVDMRQGLAMHAYLDGIPDNSALLSASRKHLEGLGTRYGNVLLDICLDHILASEWDSQFTTGLDDFALKVYDVITSRLHLLSPFGQQRMSQLIGENWLKKYSEEEELRNAMQRLSDRILERPKRYEEGLKVRESIDDIVASIPIIRAEFIPALPIIKADAGNYMSQLGYKQEGRLEWKGLDSLGESTSRPGSERK